VQLSELACLAGAATGVETRHKAAPEFGLSRLTSLAHAGAREGGGLSFRSPCYHHIPPLIDPYPAGPSRDLGVRTHSTEVQEERLAPGRRYSSISLPLPRGDPERRLQ
jgi:hypothetical protein